MLKPFKLSPSRAKDYITCPLMYKFKVVDNLPSLPTIEAVRGTHVHAVLEHVFSLVPAERTFEVAVNQIWQQWENLMTKFPNYSTQIPEVQQIIDRNPYSDEYYNSIIERLKNYWKLENPSTLTNVTGMEVYLTSPFAPSVKIHGFLDRVEETPSAGVRISDYKTGKKPASAYELDALYQMHFYALLWQKTKGTLPKQLKLLYLADGGTIVNTPTLEGIADYEEELHELILKIKQSMLNNTWDSKKSKLCSWCNFQNLCPEFAIKNNATDDTVE